MIVVCTNCSARLQVNEEKAPAGPFNVRCPKCNSSISSGPRNITTDANAVVPDSTASEQPRQAVTATTTSTVRFDATSVETNARPNTPSVEELGHLLAVLLDSSKNGDVSASRPSWKPRRALVCTAEAHRGVVSQQLTENSYLVFVAQNTREAVERIRDSQLDVVLLHSEFDAAEQGAAFVTREVNILRPAQRRRLFFLYCSHPRCAQWSRMQHFLTT